MDISDLHARHSYVLALWQNHIERNPCGRGANRCATSGTEATSIVVNRTDVRPAGSVSIVEFTLFEQRFQAMTAGPHDDFNDAMSLVVECGDQAELDRYRGGASRKWRQGAGVRPADRPLRRALAYQRCRCV